LVHASIEGTSTPDFSHDVSDSDAVRRFQFRQSSSFNLGPLGRAEQIHFDLIIGLMFDIDDEFLPIIDQIDAILFEGGLA
jgi:hypothetical protein